MGGIGELRVVLGFFVQKRPVQRAFERLIGMRRLLLISQ